MIVDVITYNGEKDIWDIHYNVLKDHVDKFIVVEFDQSFSGKPKQSTFPVAQYPDVEYHFHTEDLYSKYAESAEQSPNTHGASHWKREFMQKESIKDALTDLDDDDLVFIGDVDEVWEPPLHVPAYSIVKLKLRVYTYYLNNRSSEEFYGTILGQYGDIKNECLNHLRSALNARSTSYNGWHFTSMGGTEALKQKLTDSYTDESYATPEVIDSLDQNIKANKDFLGRDFTYAQDESEWPQYLKDHKDTYKHLCL